MEFWTLLLEAAKQIPGLANYFEQQSALKREKFAFLLDGINLCLREIVEEVEKGNRPAGACTELRDYLIRFKINTSYCEFININQNDFEKLSHLLETSVTVRETINASIVFDQGSQIKIQQALREIKEAAGVFRAQANLIRAGLN